MCPCTFGRRIFKIQICSVLVLYEEIFHMVTADRISNSLPWSLCKLTMLSCRRVFLFQVQTIVYRTIGVCELYYNMKELVSLGLSGHRVCPPAYSIMVADVMLPNMRQAIKNYQADPAMTIWSWYCVIHMLQPSTHQNLVTNIYDTGAVRQWG